jgi:hypothetical protein
MSKIHYQNRIELLQETLAWVFATKLLSKSLFGLSAFDLTVALRYE